MLIPGGLSVGVPGNIRLAEIAHRKHGRLPWARLFAPAIRLAENGFPVGPKLARSINNAPQAIRADQLSPGGFDVNLRYVICPQSPFLDSDVQEVCDGL